ncbi:MAG: hypothetical protein K9L32_00180 [Chromatiaceae bacterium]|nr:hypothetical protein [Chromatiaceae bacterium]
MRLKNCALPKRKVAVVAALSIGIGCNTLLLAEDGVTTKDETLPGTVASTLTIADQLQLLNKRVRLLQQRVTALQGGPYSDKTFKGVYQCVESRGGGRAGDHWAGVTWDSFDYRIEADGEGRAIVEEQGDLELDLVWHVSQDANGLVTLQPNQTFRDYDPDGPVTIAYSVSATGKITVDTGDSDYVHDNWISRDGRTLIGRYAKVRKEIDDQGKNVDSGSFSSVTCLRMGLLP